MMWHRRQLVRVLGALLSGALLAAGCSGTAEPGEVLSAAQKALADNRIESFASYLTAESRDAFYLAQSVGRRYGYLDDESFRFLADLAPGQAVYHDGIAELPVTLGQRTGVLCLVQVEGEWKLELLRVSPCLEGSVPPEPTLPMFGQPLSPGPAVDLLMPAGGTP